jgi:hypothetical protein
MLDKSLGIIELDEEMAKMCLSLTSDYPKSNLVQEPN